MLLLWIGAAHAALPLPDYTDDLALAVWYTVNETLEDACARDASGGLYCDEEMLRSAIREAEHFQYNLFSDARLEYLIGLAWKLRDHPNEAERKFRQAIRMDANRQDAWHDLGEILLQRGRYAEARLCFAHVDRLLPDGPNAWIGPWRLAEVSAHLQDPEAFELHMREALRRGFSFQQIRGLPNWRAFYADPVMRDSIEKMVTVYGDPKVLDTLQPRQ